MRVLGVDPGTVRMGYGVIEDATEGAHCLAWGVLHESASSPLHQRLHGLHRQLQSIMEEWRPEEVAVEEPFVSVGRGMRTAISLGQSQGVALIVAAEYGLDVHSYAPKQVKQMVTNYGGSSKVQVQEAVSLLLGLKIVPEPPDAADALAVAICHLWHRAASRLVSGGD